MIKYIDYNTTCITIQDLASQYKDIETEISLKDKSRFVEAIFLKLPHYPIYIDEKTKEVLIGAKIVQSYADYFNNEFSLTTTFIKEFEGMKFRELAPYCQIKFGYENITVIKVKSAEQGILNFIKK